MKANDDLHAYKVGPFTVLEWMLLLAVLGIILAWLVSAFSLHL